MINPRLLCILILLGSAATARGAVLVDQAYRLDKHNRPTTDLMINGKGPFSFVLDTASSTSFIFAAARDRLGLIHSGTGPAFDTYGFSTMIKSEPLTLDEVQLSGLTIQKMRMGVLDAPTDADGILGIDALEKYILVLDRSQMRLKLISPDDSSPQPWRNWTSVDMQPRVLRDIGAIFWSTQVNIGGRPATAILDLGAGITIINWAAAERLGIQRREFNSAGPPDKRLRDMLGTAAPAVNFFGTIMVGDQYFPDQRILIADAQVFDFAGLANVPAALIGTGLLHDHSVAVDFPHRRFYVGRDASSP